MNDKIIKEDMDIVIVGHVDHGKSTIIGRLLADTHSLPIGKLEQIKINCKRNAKPFEYAFLIDALKEEQSQGITIDAARCFFNTPKRKYMILDAPGHIEFLKNMITGAARAEAAILVIDAHEGIQENSKRHAYMLSLLGIKQICIAINKMDLVKYDQSIYKQIVLSYSQFLSKLGLKAQYYIPISGINGDNIAINSSEMKWYNGPTILEALDLFKKEDSLETKPFRMPVQDVYKFTENGDNRRIIAGTIESGTLFSNDKVIFYPSGKTGTIKTIESFNEDFIENISSGYAAGVTLTEQIFITRGEIMAKTTEKPLQTTTLIKTNLFWLGQNPMKKEKRYFLKLLTAKVAVQIEEIIEVLDTSDLSVTKKDFIEKNEVAKCILRTEKPIAFDVASELMQTSRFVIVEDYEIVGGGMIEASLEDKKETKEEHKENSQPFQCTYTGKSLEILNKLNISLILSTYQAGKVIILSSDGKNMYQLLRDFERPMGIAIKGDLMALAGAMGVTVFRTDQHLAKSYPNKPDTYDAFYYPTAVFKTDYVDIHDIAFTTKGLVGVNTSFSCLAELNGQYSFNPIWKPYFIDKFVPEDLCHLNGMAVDQDEKIRYVTGFGSTSDREGWRKNKMTSGILMDVDSNSIILDKLPMPHSPRIYKNELYLLLSGSEELIKVDIESKTYSTIAKIDGFIRGLSFKDNYAFIGVSKLRNTHTFGDLDIVKKDISAGVVIIDLDTGNIAGEIKYNSSVEEIYDVHILDGFKRVNILNYQQSLRQRALITPLGCRWVENRDDNKQL